MLIKLANPHTKDKPRYVTRIQLHAPTQELIDYWTSKDIDNALEVPQETAQRLAAIINTNNIEGKLKTRAQVVSGE